MLVLEDLGHKDIDLLARWLKSEKKSIYLKGCPLEYAHLERASLKFKLDQKENIFNSNRFFWIKDQTEAPVGLLILYDLDWKNKNVFMTLVLGQSQNKDLLFSEETYKLITAYVFGALKMHKLSYLLYDFDDLELLPKISGGCAVKEGILRQQAFVGNRYVNVNIFSLFNSASGGV